MDKNQIKGAAKQGERALNREALVIKAKRRKSGGCATKDCVLTWGDLALRLKGRQQKSWSEESAEVVVVAGGALKATSLQRRTKREGVIEPMSMSKELHQMPAEHAGQTAHVRGEATHKPVCDESCGPRHDKRKTGSELGSPLLRAALTRENLQQAWKRVKANKGAAGVDGLDIDQSTQMIRTQWPEIRSQLLQGTYRPSPVRRVSIPKPDGGQRELGIPTVVDRLIQQALLQVLQPILDPTFSEHSYGFRPGRSAHQAVKAARAYVQSGKRVVVDVDLEKFFDTVNHDILINRLHRRIDDAGVIRLIRAYLNSAVMDGGVVLQRDKGTPQGGPLSPLLANVLLDEVDKELERRGHSFARYADDCNVYVHSQRAGERVMALLQSLYAKLHLKVNEAKSAVASVFGRKFLGFSVLVAKGAEVKLRVGAKAMTTFKQRIRQLTRRSGGRSMAQVVDALRPYMLGWKAYFAVAQTPSVWRKLDAWIRRRLRAIQLKHWRYGTVVFRELRALGASVDTAKQSASNARRWWYKSDRVLKTVLTVAYFDELGVPRLS